MDEGLERTSTLGLAPMVVDALQKLDSGQQQLMRKVDLQMQQLAEILKLQGQTQQKSVELEPVVFDGCVSDNQPIESIFTPASVPSHAQRFPTKTRQRDQPIEGNFFSANTPPSQLVSNEGKEWKKLKAYQSAMGWSRRVTYGRDSSPQEDCLRRFALGPGWILLSMVLIVVNSVLIGVETQLTTTHAINEVMSGQSSAGSSSTMNGVFFFRLLEICFLIWLAIEVLVNAYAEKRDFYCGTQWHWNAFDVVVLVISICLQFTDMASVSFLRVLRLLRVARLLLLLRVFKFVRSVRSMVLSILGSMVHLFSASVVMCIFMYIVCLTIMQGIAVDIYNVSVEHSSARRQTANVFDGSSELTEVEQIDALYGSIYRTMMTLFFAVTGGMEWRDAAEPVARLHTSYGVTWTLYIAFMLLVVLNVVIGIFVETAISCMNNDRDNVIQAQLDEREALFATMTKAFELTDTSGSGYITEQDLELLLQDKVLLAHFNAIGIDPTEAEGLFQLLDDDDSGTVSIDEFITGFARLRGSARAVDVVSLMYENRKVTQKLSKIFHTLTILQQHTMSEQTQEPWQRADAATLPPIVPNSFPEVRCDFDNDQVVHTI